MAGSVGKVSTKGSAKYTYRGWEGRGGDVSDSWEQCYAMPWFSYLVRVVVAVGSKVGVEEPADVLVGVISVVGAQQAVKGNADSLAKHIIQHCATWITLCGGGSGDDTMGAA